MRSPIRRLLEVSREPPADHPLVIKHRRRMEAVYDTCDDLWEQVIAPLCRRRRYTFMAGNGTWVFSDRTGKMVTRERLPEDALALLEGLSAPNLCQLAAYCDDFPKAAPA